MKWFWSCTPVENALVLSGRLTNRGVTLGIESIIPTKGSRSKMGKESLQNWVINEIIRITAELPADHAYFCFNNPTLVHKEEE